MSEFEFDGSILNPLNDPDEGLVDFEGDDNSSEFEFDGSVLNQGRAVSAIKSVSQENPDQNSKILDLSKKTGIPHQAVRQDIDAVQGISRQNEVSRVLKESPATSLFFSSPDNARIAHDDVENLSAIENLMRSTGRGVDKMQGMLYGAAEFAGEAVGLNALDEFGRRGRERNKVEASQYGEGQLFTEIDDIGELGDWMIKTAGEQLPMMAPSLAGGTAGAALGLAAGPGAPLAVPVLSFLGAFLPSAILGVGETQSALKEKDPNAEATAEVAVAGGLIGLLDSVVPGKVGSRIARTMGLNVASEVAEKAVKETLVATAKKVASSGAKAATIEGITESVQEAVSEVAASFGANQDIDTESLAKAIPEAFAAGFFMGGGTTAIVDSLAEVRQRSLVDQKKIKDLSKAAENSKLRERNPEKFKEFVKGLKEEYGTDKMYLDPQGAFQLFQGMNADDEFFEGETARKILADIPKAMEEGRNVEIPIEDYITDIKSSPVSESLSAHIKTDVEAMTPSELESVDVESESVKSAAEQTQNEIERSEVHNFIANDLKETGMTPETADSNASMFTQILSTYANRAGIGVMDLYERYNLHSRRELDPAVKRKINDLFDATDIDLDRIRNEDLPTDADIYGESAVEFILKRGGISKEFAKVGKHRVFKKDGADIDEVARYLAEEGFIDEQDPNLVYEALSSEEFGEPVRRKIAQNEELLEARRKIEYTEKVLSDAGLDVQKMTNEEIKEALHDPEAGLMFQGDENSDAFKKWFGDSKVVDDEGKPLVVYHGTASDISEFKKNKATDKLGRALGLGLGKGKFYFTTHPGGGSQAAFGAQSTRERPGHSPNVMPVFLSIKKPIQEKDYILRLNEILGGEIPYDQRGRQSQERRDKAIAKLDKQLKREGFDGIVDEDSGQIAVFSPTQIKSIHNRGTFDPNDPRILFQSPENSRGYFEPGKNRITFTRNSDLTTFLHEMSHFFFEVMQDLAPNAKDIQEDVDILNKWFRDNNAKDDRERHEMFASGFEEYVMEGKAPIPELRQIFETFKQWLVMVYKSILKSTPFRSNSLEHVHLSDEVRGVMDRMLASQEAIDQARSAQNFDNSSAIMMGLDEDLSAEYAKIRQLAKNEANQQLSAKIFGELKREKDKWWRKEVKRQEEDVAKELDDSRDYRARDFLTGERIPEGAVHEKLDSDYIKKMYGADAVQRFKFMANKNGVHPDKIAVMLGYKNGNEMVMALMNTMNKKERKEYVNKEAESRVRAEHGDIMLDGSIIEQAQDAVHNEHQGQLIAIELRILNKKLNKDFVAKGTAKDVRGIYKAAAVKAVSSMPVDELRPDIYMRNEQKHGRQAYILASEDKWAEARDAKHRQLRQFYMYRAAMDAKEQAEKHKNRLNQMKKGKYSARKVHPDYIQQLKVLLSAYDLRKDPKKSESAVHRVRNFIQSQQAANPDLVADAMIDSITSWNSMTMAELKALRDAAENILAIGKMNGAESREAFKKKVSDLSMHITKKMGGKPKNKVTNKSGVASFGRGVKNFFSGVHRKLESFAQQLDGWMDNGMVAEEVFRPLYEAQVKELERGIEEHKLIGELFQGYDYLFNGFKDNLQSVEMTKRFVDLYEIPIGKHGATRSLSRGERIVLALNWGNEGNREAILNQDKMPLDEEDVLNAIGTLTKDELELVNRIWEYVDKFYPEIASIEQKATGIAPEKVQAEPFTVNGVKMRGGYYPLLADSTFSWRAEMQEVEDRAKKNMRGGSLRASTKHGSTIERVDFGGKVVDLSIDTLFKHVDGVVHDITHREAVREVDSLLRARSVREAIEAAIGQDDYRAMMNAVTRVAGGNFHPSDLPIMNKIFRFSRVAASYGAMGYSVRTALLNITGFFPALAEVGPVKLTSALMRQMVHPVDFGKNIKDKSVMMSHRGETINRDVYEVLRTMKANKKYNALYRNAFLMIVKVDQFVSRSVWDASYNDSIESGMSEKDAVYNADRTVNRTQGTGMKIDLSAVEDQNEIVRALSPMYTYFNTILNLSKRRFGKMRTGQISKARYANDMFWIFIVTALVEEAMFGGREDEDEEEKLKRFQLSIPTYYMNQWFGIRELSSFVKYGKMFETPLQRMMSAPFKFGKEAAELAFDEDAEFDKQSIRAGTDLLPILGFPSGLQVNRMASYLYDYERDGGEFEPYGFFVTGKRSDN